MIFPISPEYNSRELLPTTSGVLVNVHQLDLGVEGVLICSICQFLIFVGCVALAAFCGVNTLTMAHFKLLYHINSSQNSWKFNNQLSPVSTGLVQNTTANKQMPRKENLLWKRYRLPDEGLSSLMDEGKQDSWEPTELSRQRHTSLMVCLGNRRSYGNFISWLKNRSRLKLRGNLTAPPSFSNSRHLKWEMI